MNASFEAPRPTRWDALVALAILLLAAAVTAALRSGPAFAGTDRLTAVVSVDGREADRVSLWTLQQPETRTYAGQGYTLKIEFTPGGVRVAEADCPNLDCVHTGQISGPGRSVVCLPARITVQLTGDGGVDAVPG